jgi:hypothetical protein
MTEEEEQASDYDLGIRPRADETTARLMRLQADSFVLSIGDSY